MLSVVDVVVLFVPVTRCKRRAERCYFMRDENTGLSCFYLNLKITFQVKTSARLTSQSTPSLRLCQKMSL